MSCLSLWAFPQITRTHHRRCASTQFVFSASLPRPSRPHPPLLSHSPRSPFVSPFPTGVIFVLHATCLILSKGCTPVSICLFRFVPTSPVDPSPLPSPPPTTNPPTRLEREIQFSHPPPSPVARSSLRVPPRPLHPHPPPSFRLQVEQSISISRESLLNLEIHTTHRRAPLFPCDVRRAGGIGAILAATSRTTPSGGIIHHKTGEINTHGVYRKISAFIYNLIW